MRRVAIVQARMGSTRLPGKVLLDLEGRPLLVRVLDRLRSCTALDEVMVATSVAPEDDAIAEACRAEGVPTSRGSGPDVLGRYVGAARESHADLVVRVTADCPLIDPDVVDRVVNALTEHAATADYASNVLRRTFPRGLDAEALFFDTLLRVDRMATTPLDREHVTVAIRSSPEAFRVCSVESDTDDSDLRWTVDEAADLDLVRRLYRELDLGSRAVPYKRVVEHVRRDPELTRINADATTWNPTGSGSDRSEATAG